MKSLAKYLFFIIIVFTTTAYSQSRSTWGLGITLGDPTGFTVKYNVNRNNAWNFNLGSSYFGELRMGADYLWHFDPFNSRNVAMHAGFGGVLGIGESNSVIYNEKNDRFYVREDDLGIAVRGLVGIDFYPNSSPFEIFFELGPLIGIAPNIGGALDVAFGFRFYP